MTVTEERRAEDDALSAPAHTPGDSPPPGSVETLREEGVTPGGRAGWRPTRARVRRWASLGLMSVLVLAAAEAVVFYGVGSLLHSRDQRSLSAAERQQIQAAAGAQDGLYRKAPPTLPPAPGSPVGMLVVPALGLEQAVVEGVGASQTAEGPGHVPGTAGLGQPGNAAVVGRGAGDGAPFASLGTLRRGDHIVTATTQGESLYVVASVETGAVVTHAPVTRPASGLQPLGAHPSAPSHTAASTGPRHRTKIFNLQALFGAAARDQLTLVTSGSGVPWNSNDVVVVVARMRGTPYAPTPQEGRSLQQQGTTGDANALPWLLLAMLGMAAVMAVAAQAYRRISVRSAYLLTSAPLLAMAIVVALLASRLFPAWS